MSETEKIINTVIDAIQDKKGRRIVVTNLSRLDDTICNYIIICEGNTPSQVSAIADSVEDKVRKEVGIKPIGTEGMANSLWIVIDYADVMVHVFVPDAREFYDLDNFWEDAPKREVPDVY